MRRSVGAGGRYWVCGIRSSATLRPSPERSGVCGRWLDRRCTRGGLGAVWVTRSGSVITWRTLRCSARWRFSRCSLTRPARRTGARGATGRFRKAPAIWWLHPLKPGTFAGTGIVAAGPGANPGVGEARGQWPKKQPPRWGRFRLPASRGSLLSFPPGRAGSRAWRG